LLSWFGVDLTAGPIPLDLERACAACGAPVVAGEDSCPIHLGGAVANEGIAAAPRVLRVLVRASLVALLGLAVGLIVGDTRFGWLGAVAAGAQVAARVALETRQPRIAGALGLVAFFAAVVLLFAGLLVTSITVLPLVLEQLLGT
jgi:hypothetical protein